MAGGGRAVTRVLGWIWRIVTGVYRTVIVLVILAGAALLWIDLRGGPAIHVPRDVALVIKPSGALVESEANPTQRLLDRFSGARPGQTSLRELRQALRAAATDPRIKVAVLDFDDLGNAGVAQLDELSRSIARFRASGKPVYAYGTGFDQYQYLPAVQADSISMDPMGVVLLQGFGVYGEYFKDALDRLGVEVNVFRVGAFKSAVEPFLRNDMSPDARLANRAWLGELWSTYQRTVVGRRQLADGALDAYIAGLAAGLQSAGGNGAALALADKLVDRIQTRDEFREFLGKQVGMDAANGSFRQISARRYLRAWRREHPVAKGLDRIGVIVVEGNIVAGRSGRNSAGGETIAGLLDAAARSARVKAVVLRVNSPGGSVVAAEQIRRAERRLQSAGKPLVVSMSTMAASGGYWIAMDADRILAEPTTITGSIGIFGLLPNIEKPLARLGIHSDGVGTSPLAGGFGIARPLSDTERTIIQSQVNYGYALFTQGVAKGRRLPLATVQEIAQGRVWSGEAGKRLGLVDAFGGERNAVEDAARLAHLAPGHYAAVGLRASASLAQLVKARFGGHSGLAALIPEGAATQAWRGALQRSADAFVDFNDPRGQYAYCFCTLDGAPAWR
ncbi:MAG TPA: signal peptide peptidase SppA [Nevskiaceae bacterium]